MKTKFWILILAVILVVCAGFSAFLFLGNGSADAVQITSDGKLLYTLPLSVDQQIEIQSEYGTNTVTIKNGKVAVTQADCPDHYCMDRGFCDSGAQIVCLPNRLVLTFTQAGEVDGVVG